VVTLYGVAPPILKVGMQSPETLFLSWTQAAVGFLLQSSVTLTPPPGWLADTNAVAISNNLATVNTPITASRFYRLALP
jgi:hypothetical protein